MGLPRLWVPASSSVSCSAPQANVCESTGERVGGPVLLCLQTLMRHKRRRVEIAGLKLHFSYQDWRAMCHLGGCYQRAMHLHLSTRLAARLSCPPGRAEVKAFEIPYAPPF